MKMDIRGYFMHIDRERLLDICLGTLRKMAGHKVSKHRLRRRLMLSEPAFIKYGVFDICYRRYFCAFKPKP